MVLKKLFVKYFLVMLLGLLQFSCLLKTDEQNKKIKELSIEDLLEDRIKVYYGEIEGEAVVLNGDTFKIYLNDSIDLNVQLYGIDAPEGKQAFSAEAKLGLEELIDGKQVKVIFEIGPLKENEKYARLLGKVYQNKINISQQMVELGLAWHYLDFAPTDDGLACLQENARSNKIGLWADPNPIPPWEYRNSLKHEDK